jgi:Pyruvate/2-oxoacid:ferredoxin oxidoreductase gamma subunit
MEQYGLRETLSKSHLEAADEINIKSNVTNVWIILCIIQSFVTRRKGGKFVDNGRRILEAVNQRRRLVPEEKYGKKERKIGQSKSTQKAKEKETTQDERFRRPSSRVLYWSLPGYDYIKLGFVDGTYKTPEGSSIAPRKGK